MADTSLFARHYIDYIYVPGALLIAGTAIVKSEWLIYAIPIAILFGAYNFWNFRKFFFFANLQSSKGGKRR